MGLRFKRGVSCRGITPELLLAIQVANECHFKMGYDCIITSLLDGQHSRGSRHYLGHAVDLRVRHIKDIHRETIADEIRARLSPLGDFDVMYEDVDTDNAHIHIQYKPKGE